MWARGLAAARRVVVYTFRRQNPGTIRITSNPAQYAKFAAITFSAVLAGCQTLRDWTDHAPEAVQQQEISYVDSRVFPLLAQDQVVGRIYTLRLRDGDTLPDVARHYGLGHEDIVRANPGIDTWVPTAGSRVLLPMRHVVPDVPREGIVLNLANMRLFYFPPENHGPFVHTYAVGIGREGWETPTGVYDIAEKKVDPTWIPPVSILEEHEKKGDPLPRVVPPGPENPLGDYALRLNDPVYLIHGTNKPYGVGLQISHGCVRLYPEDIESLYIRTELGARVQIVDQAYLVGWDAGDLYLEAHPPLEGRPAHPEHLEASLRDRLAEEARQHGVTIDWARVEDVLRRQDGIPAPILAGSPGFEAMAATAPAVAHPGRFHGQPMPGSLGVDDWSIAVASFDDEIEARRVAAVLNHQGPPIPARPVRGESGYQVIAGPYKHREEVEAVAEQIRRDFKFDAKPLPPETASATLP